MIIICTIEVTNISHAGDWVRLTKVFGQHMSGGESEQRVGAHEQTLGRRQQLVAHLHHSSYRCQSVSQSALDGFTPIHSLALFCDLYRRNDKSVGVGDGLSNM